VKLLLAAALAALPLAAVAQERPYRERPTQEVVTRPDGSRRTVVHTDLAVWGHRDAERLKEREDVTAAQARAFLADKTRLSFSSQHGPQVAYARPDGAIFLWYPGNAVVLQGRWEVRENVTDYVRAGQVLRSLKSADVCFQYGANTYNPATGQRGGGFNCMPLRALQLVHREALPGDVFGLARHPAPPFVLGREAVTLAALRARAGALPAGAPASGARPVGAPATAGAAR
jgi:hypothetical protein